jgi:hypothetical protein
MVNSGQASVVRLTSLYIRRQPVGRKRGGCVLWGSHERDEWHLPGLRERLALQTRLTVALGAGQEYILGQWRVDNGNSG